jgi:hypothetical protein
VKVFKRIWFVKHLIKKIGAVFFAIICGCYSGASVADEVISNYVSNVFINSNGSADVIEAITLRANGNKIKYGIVRWLPIFYKDKNNLTRIQYSFSGVTVNSLPAVYHVNYTGKLLTIVVGSEKELLPPGTYTYTLQYRVNNAVIAADDADHFYWNITGNNWTVPIENVDATVHLPKGAGAIKYAGFTGNPGSTARDFFTTSTIDGNILNFTTTATLMPGAGLKVGVSWPQGFVHRPIEGQQFLSQFLRQFGAEIGVLITIILLFYFLSVWYLECREPAASKIIPQFQPPAMLSAAGMRYVYLMAYDLKSFAAAIISVATKRYLRILAANNKNFTLLKTRAVTKNLATTEIVMATHLFTESDTVALTPANAHQIKAANQQLKKSLKVEFENSYFVIHLRYFVPGLVIGLCSLVAVAYLTIDVQQAIKLGLMLTLALILLSVQLPKACEEVAEYGREPAAFNKTASMLMLRHLFLSFCLILLIVLTIGPLAEVLTTTGLVLLTVNIFLQVVFYHLFKVHTRQGRLLMDQIEGFKLYLMGSSQQRPDKLIAPPKTAELFEKYLPYAIALGVENSWVEQFVSVLYSQKTGQQSYAPVWFKSKGEFNIVDTAEFVTAISEDLNTALSD